MELGAVRHVSTFTASSKSEVSEVDVEPLFGYQVLIEGRPLSRASWNSRR